MAVPFGESPHTDGDERLLAACSHLAIFFAPVVLPLGLWLWERHKENGSSYLIFQARQALVYQLLFVTVILGLGAMAVALSVWLLGTIFLPAYFMLLAAAMVYGAYAGYQCFRGMEFRYSLVADWMDHLAE
ncbi:MAG: DUF4870 domain-containing protein [Calditrichaeota bacterium]|nr:MAG: DUF4870 domain-containing protein [Calditrichota bacterium]